MKKVIRLIALVGVVALAGVAAAPASAWPNSDKHTRRERPIPRTVPEPSDLLMLSAGVSVVFALRRRLSLGK
jgi:hypothetical protein